MGTSLAEAHQIAWQRIGQPGTWLSGAQRIAIAIETRNATDCELCAQRKAALSPYSIEGTHTVHATRVELPDDMIDAAHRITTDPSRLTKDWHNGLSISDAEYVELVGVSITAIGIDTFDRAVGNDLRELPEAQPGEPSRRRPSDAVDPTAWIPMRKLPGAPNVARALSLVPAEAKALQALVGVEYVPPLALIDLTFDPGRSISRQQMELIAARVSAHQDCFY